MRGKKGLGVAEGAWGYGAGRAVVAVVAGRGAGLVGAVGGCGPLPESWLCGPLPESWVAMTRSAMEFGGQTTVKDGARGRVPGRATKERKEDTAVLGGGGVEGSVRGWQSGNSKWGTVQGGGGGERERAGGSLAPVMST